MSLVYSAIAASLFGWSNYLGAVTSRDSHDETTYQIMFWAGFGGLLVLPVALIVVPSGGPSAESFWWGAVSGVMTVSGMLGMLRGLRIGVASVITPVVASLTPVPAVLVFSVLGERIEPLGWAGITLAVVAIIIVSRKESSTALPPGAGPLAWATRESFGQRMAATGIGWGVWAGLSFGLSIMALGLTPTDAGAWPILAMRPFLLGVPVAILWSRTGGVSGVRDALSLPPRIRRLSRWIGLSGVIGQACFLVATSGGQAARQSVIISLNPVVTVILAVLLLGERLRPAQQAGVLLALVGAVLIGLG